MVRWVQQHWLRGSFIISHLWTTTKKTHTAGTGCISKFVECGLNNLFSAPTKYTLEDYIFACTFCATRRRSVLFQTVHAVKYRESAAGCLNVTSLSFRKWIGWLEECSAATTTIRPSQGSKVILRLWIYVYCITFGMGVLKGVLNR